VASFSMCIRGGYWLRESLDVEGSDSEPFREEMGGGEVVAERG
jgi:hypothetical protein